MLLFPRIISKDPQSKKIFNLNSQNVRNFFPSRMPMKPLIRKEINIDGAFKYKQFIKNKDKVYRLKINYNDSKVQHVQKKLDKIILKFLHKVRGFQALDLHQGLVGFDLIPRKQIIQVAKLHSRVQALSLPFIKSRNTTFQDILPQYILWLKYLSPSLKGFSLISLINQSSDNETRNFKQYIKSLFRTFKQFPQLESLTIHPKNPDQLNIEAWICFQDYPLGLKKLGLNFSTNVVVIDPQRDGNLNSLAAQNLSLSKFTKLTHLDLALPANTLLWSRILSSIPKINSLTHIKFCHHIYGTPNHNLKVSPDDYLHIATQLKSLQIEFHQYPQGLENLFPQLENYKNLTSFQFIIQNKSTLNFNLESLLQFLEKQTKLQILVLKFYNDWSSTKAQKFLTKLYLYISNLKTLQQLKLHFYASTQYQVQFDPSVQDLFKKSRSIKVFDYVHDGSGPNLLPELLKLSEQVAPTLEELTIVPKKINLAENDHLIKEIFRLLEKLKNIQVLKLSHLSFQQGKYFLEFIRYFSCFKHLKYARLPSFICEINKEDFFAALENIMSLKGMESLELPFVEFRTSKTRNKLDSSLQSIQIKNPEAKIWDVYYKCTDRYDDRYSRNWKKFVDQLEEQDE